MLTGNKGEWSEIYVFLKLLGEGKLHNINSNFSGPKFCPIIKIIRKEPFGTIIFTVNQEENKILVSHSEGSVNISASKFTTAAICLLNKIKSSSGPLQCPELEGFLSLLKISTLKANSDSKADIIITFYDSQIQSATTLGFSIKSYLGSNSTLFNAAQGSNFTYILTDISETSIKEINSISTRSKIKDRVKKICSSGVIEYYPESESILHGNLSLVDSALPEIFSKLILYYFNKKSKSSVSELVRTISENNPLKIDKKFQHLFYETKIKRFLVSCALGLTASKIWNGKYDSASGYIIVSKNGEIYSDLVFNRNDFEDYLLHNTKFDTPDPGRHKFGNIFKENGRWYIKLNVSIRFN